MILHDRESYATERNRIIGLEKMTATRKKEKDKRRREYEKRKLRTYRTVESRLGSDPYSTKKKRKKKEIERKKEALCRGKGDLMPN